MGKKEDRKARAAAARALLGLDEGESNERAARPVERASRSITPKRDGGSRPTGSAAKPAGQSSGAPAPSRPSKQASEQRQQLDAALERQRRGEPIGRQREGTQAYSSVRVPDQLSASMDERKEQLAQVTDASGKILEKSWPKKHAHGSLKRGDSVWYRGFRYWIEWAPDHWSKGCYVRICDQQVNPNPNIPLPVERSLTGSKEHVLSFCIHADLLALAPPVAMYHAAPSLSAEQRKERAKQGIHDVGDPVAVLLRGAKTLDDVYRIAAKYLSVKVEELKSKYGHLNAGQQRMNCGNRMRGYWRKNGSPA